MSFDTTTTNPSSQPSMVDKWSTHASNVFSGWTGLFSKKKNDPNAPVYTGGRTRRRRSSRSRKGSNPKKGMASKTRKGRKDFITHKGDKYYNRKGHRQSRNAKGKRKSPYKKH